MRIGTKTLLFGIHQFLLHPIFLLIAWKRLYGWPRDFRIIVAMIVHDWGYWRCRDLDGPEGQRHPELGARIMTWLFGPEWGAWTRRHSKTYAKLENAEVSALWRADKLASAIYPTWLYIGLSSMTGEIDGYMELGSSASVGREKIAKGQRWDKYVWYAWWSRQIALKVYDQHKQDILTPAGHEN